ncbi:hypothetical protein G6F31_015857 [Rhizopus arrhizus]|nr:hypothetical protein G6F31_015857 [Rhizopus arrhizus]
MVLDRLQRLPHERHDVAVAQHQQQQADAQHDAHADVGMLALGGGVVPQQGFTLLGVGLVVLDALAEGAARRHDGAGGVRAGARNGTGFQMLALHRDAARDQGVEAGLHGVQEGGRGILARQRHKRRLLPPGFVQRGVDAAAFFRRLGGLACACIFQLARQPQPRAHDLIVDPGQGGDFVQEFVAGSERFACAVQAVDADGRQAGEQGADHEQGAQDHAADGDVFQELCHASRTPDTASAASTTTTRLRRYLAAVSQLTNISARSQNISKNHATILRVSVFTR